MEGWGGGVGGEGKEEWDGEECDSHSLHIRICENYKIFMKNVIFMKYLNS